MYNSSVRTSTAALYLSYTASKTDVQARLAREYRVNVPVACTSIELLVVLPKETA